MILHYNCVALSEYSFLNIVKLPKQVYITAENACQILFSEAAKKCFLVFKQTKNCCVFLYTLLIDSTSKAVFNNSYFLLKIPLAGLGMKLNW